MTLLPQEVIRAKRDGEALDPADISGFIEGLTRGTVGEGQAAAFAMAVFFNGMSREEAVALTLAMRDSGDVLDWPDIDRPIIDKHSTGGVGDNVSLMLAPIVAACGAMVPMISGRGLGHTGGTLDKLDSIPGYITAPSSDLFRRTVKETGCAIIGQTGDLAPADKRLYAIRDVTATVESVPLITASILSKKLAAGLGALVLDVKCGNGSFMGDVEKGRELARSLVAVANGAGLRTSAVLTDMNEPLASAAGNAVEVDNAVRFLTGERQDPRLRKITLTLAANMLVSGGLAADVDAGFERASRVLDDGHAAEIFGKMVSVLGGPADFVDRCRDHLETAPLVVDIAAREDGWIAGYDTRRIGMAVVALGGGRTRPEDDVDHAVGLTGFLPVGTKVAKGEPLFQVHARSGDQVEMVRERLADALTISGDAVGTRPVIMETIAAEQAN
ncbi:thymidine phosphorylase [Pseudohoeflea suaedae]|uniref:Thymidine phosphorylase n=1 Tax=Pseudohoeflea suaedae TaxID=877384 RepID=A0A4R5PLS9_9HYPH|nr:thymidine phosphorylase [Pseudohoeflea suaedae]TDH37914.1 thymidine phosphorylase [Pseudohoeflea suaedae]